MTASITFSGSRVAISGSYKQFTTTAGSTPTVIQYGSGEAPASSDAGRFLLWCKDSTIETGGWEVRRIISSTTSSITAHDAFSAAPGSSELFRISSSLTDLISAQPSCGTRLGLSTFQFNGDLSLTSNAFLGSADETAEWVFPGTDPVFPTSNGCVLQLGQLWGGENSNSNETTNGSRWYLRQNAGNNSVFTTTNARSVSGAVINYYGSLVESTTNSGYLFSRYLGPARMIGCIFDGVMGGRFYHEKSEWIECRHSGNNNVTPAWSIGATFIRPIDDIKFFQNLVAIKNYIDFSGTFKNCDFSSSNGTVIRVDSTSLSSIFNFIDCTEFPDSKINDNGTGILNQYRSVNMTITNVSGAALSGAALRINDKNGTVQGSIQTSDVSGACGEILCLRSQWNSANPSITFYPYTIRIRKYGYLPVILPSSVDEPISQFFALNVDPNITANQSVASTYSSKFSIDTNGNVLVNANSTLDELYDYQAYWQTLGNTNMIASGNDLYLFNSDGTELSSTKNITITNGYELSQGSIFDRVSTTGLISSGPSGLISVPYEDSTGFTTLVRISNLTSSNIYIENDVGSQQVYLTNQSGTYEYFIPTGSSGTWRVVIKRLGYARKYFFPEVDGITKEYDGELIQKIDFMGDPIYQGQTNSLITVETNTPSAGFHKIDIGDGFVTGSEIYDMVEQELMTAEGISSYDFMVDYAPTSNGNYLVLGANVQLRRRTAGDDNAGVNAIVSQADGIPIDGSNGPVAISTSPSALTKQDVRNAMALALGIGVVPEDGSIDKTLQKIQNHTSIIPSEV